MSHQLPTAEIKPDDFFPISWVKKIAIVPWDGEYCWVWTGDTIHNKPVASQNKNPQRLGFAQIEPVEAKERVLKQICRKPLCVNPEHQYTNYSPTGRWAFIEDNLVEQGDCELWLGQLRSGKPFMQIGKNKYALVARWVYADNHQKDLDDLPTVVNTCGNERCINVHHYREITFEEFLSL